MPRLTRIFHVLYALLLTWSAVKGVGVSVTLGSTMWLAFVCAYWTAVAGIYRDWRIAWLLSVIPPAYFTWVWGRMFVVNQYMYETGHELYLDSPATILVVYIYAIVFLLPSMALVVLSLLNLRRVQKSIQQESQ